MYVCKCISVVTDFDSQFVRLNPWKSMLKTICALVLLYYLHEYSCNLKIFASIDEFTSLKVDFFKDE